MSMVESISRGLNVSSNPQTNLFGPWKNLTRPNLEWLSLVQSFQSVNIYGPPTAYGALGSAWQRKQFCYNLCLQETGNENMKHINDFHTFISCRPLSLIIGYGGV